jgi:metallophosphoesterase (TIGR00282 family)
MKQHFHVPAKPDRSLRVIVLGDVVGRPGRTVLKDHLKAFRESVHADLVVVNGENAAGGAGIDPSTALEIRNAGADVITLGDHAFQRKGSAEFLDKNGSWCIRPINLPADTTPGVGSCAWQSKDGVRVCVVNVLGRVFMGGVAECPFRAMSSWLDTVAHDGPAITICDLHAEATSEKWAMGRHVDGKLSLLVGTHTHVQTSDAQVLPGGTAYITDLGMTGANTGVIGMDARVALNRFLGPKPAPYEIAEGEGIMHGVIADIDEVSRKAIAIYLVNH